MNGRDPTSLGDVLRGVLRRLGVADLELWRRIETEWAELAGSPWDSHSRPASLGDGVLVVEATSPAAVSLLRYGVTGLRARLSEQLGEGVVTEVVVRPPRRGRER
jgi:predicted nucleic acid-binding Zn ribbon protein